MASEEVSDAPEMVMEEAVEEAVEEPAQAVEAEPEAVETFEDLEEDDAPAYSKPAAGWPVFQPVFVPKTVPAKIVPYGFQHHKQQAEADRHEKERAPPNRH